MDFSKIVKSENSLFNRIVQIGVAVKDIDKTLEVYKNAFGWEAFAFADTPDGIKLYRGEVEDFSVRMAFIRFEHIEIELCMPTRGKNVWQDFIDARGEGIHHILFDVPDFEKAKKFLESKGIMMVQTGPSARYPGGRWAYFDATEQLGHYIEIFNPSELGYDCMALPKESNL